jgi:hypothetical protein
VETAAKNLEMAAKTKQKTCEQFSAEVNGRTIPMFSNYTHSLVVNWGLCTAVGTDLERFVEHSLIKIFKIRLWTQGGLIFQKLLYVMNFIV